MADNNFDISNFGIEETQEVNLESTLNSWMSDSDEVEPVETTPVEVTDGPTVIPQTTEEELAADELFVDDETPEEVVVTPEDESIEEDEPEETQYQNIANDFYDMGLLQKEDDETPITTAEELKERFFKEKMKGANEQLVNFLSRFGDKYMKAFDSIFVKGVDPEQYFQLAKATTPLEGLDLENQEDQKKVITQYYAEHLGYKPERAVRLIQMLEEQGELDSEATMAFEKITEKNQHKIAEKEEEAQKQQQLKQQQENFYNHSVNTIIQDKLKSRDFDGIPLTDKVAQTALANLTQKPYKLTSTGELISDFDYFLLSLKDPKNLDVALKIELLRQNNFDFSKIKQKGVSEKSDKLFQSLVTKEKSAKRKTSTTKVDNFQI